MRTYGPLSAWRRTMYPLGFTPANLGGLWLWLRADLGVTRDGANRVSAWNDQSGKGNHLIQAVGADQPLFVASGINSQAVVRFAAANTEWMSNVALDANHVQPTTLFFVLNYTASATQRAIINRVGATNPGAAVLGSGSGSVLRITANTALDSVTAASGGAKGFCGVYGTSGEIYIQNFTTADVAGTTNTAAWTTAGIYLGRNNAGTTFADGDIAELVAMDGTATAAQRASMRTYFNTRYALGIT